MDGSPSQTLVFGKVFGGANTRLHPRILCAPDEFVAALIDRLTPDHYCDPEDTEDDDPGPVDPPPYRFTEDAHMHLPLLPHESDTGFFGDRVVSKTKSKPQSIMTVMHLTSNVKQTIKADNL